MINTVYPWEVISKVAEEGSFNRAAKVLNITPSAVSHAVSKLEEEYGVVFFLRNHGNVRLTENGRLLLPYIEHYLQSGHTLEQQLREISDIRSGHVRIAAFNSAASDWLPEILRSFYKEYPGIRVEVFQNSDTKIKEMVDRGSIDLALMPQVLTDSHHPFDLLFRTPLICLTPEDYTPINGHSVTPEDLRDIPIILQSEGYDTEIIGYVADQDLLSNVAYRIEVDDTCHKYVEEGFGFCITAEMTALCNPRRFHMWPLEPVCYREIGLVTVYPDYISPSANLLKQYLLDYMRTHNYINV